MSADGNRTGRFFYILKNMGSADTQVSPNSLIQYIVVYMTVKKGHLSKSKFLLLNTIRQQNTVILTLIYAWVPSVKCTHTHNSLIKQSHLTGLGIEDNIVEKLQK